MAAPGTSWREIGDCPRRPESKILPDVAWDFLSFERFFIVINVRQEASQALVRVPWDELRGKKWRLSDQLSGESYERSGDDMRDAGLYVDLKPWQCCLFQARAL